MDKETLMIMISNFFSGFVLQFLRGFRWFTDLWIDALALGAAPFATWLVDHAQTPEQWAIGIMKYTLLLYGAVHASDRLAKFRSAVNLPAAVMPKVNELSGTKEGESGT